MRGAGDTTSISSVVGGGCSGAIGTQSARRASSSVTGTMTLVPRRPEHGASTSPALPSFLRRVNATGSETRDLSGSFLGRLNRSAQVGEGSSSGIVPQKPRQPEELNAERHRGDSRNRDGASDRGEGSRFERIADVSRLGRSDPVSSSIVREPGSARIASGLARRGVTDSLSSSSSSFMTSRGLPRASASSSVLSIPAFCASSASRGSPPNQQSSGPVPASLSAASGHRQPRGDRPPRVTGVANNVGGSSSAETYRGSSRDTSSVADRRASS